jgi:hypothetical protein
MLAFGCAWLRSRFAPLTAVAASLSGRCRLRRNAGVMEGGPRSILLGYYRLTPWGKGFHQMTFK